MGGDHVDRTSGPVRHFVRAHRKGLLVSIAGGGLVILALLVAVGLAYRTYQHVKGPLSSAQQTLTSLAHNPAALNSATGREATETQLAVASNEVAQADSEISSSVGLKVLGLVPGLHLARVGLDQLVSDLRGTAVASLQLLRSVNALAADSHGTDISLPGLTTLGSEMGVAKEQLAGDIRSSAGLWGPIGKDRQKFDREDRRAVHLLTQGVDLTRYAIPFLGADGPRTYLVAGENNAEMRDQGSTLSYSVMTTSDGTISLTNGGSVGNLTLTSPAAGVVVPTGTEKVFGGLSPTQTWQSTNATANFSFSGYDMQSMYAAATGQHVNGVMGIDVVALEGLLALTGPVSVAGIPEAVTAQNAADILLHQLYEGLPPNSPQGPRREELAAVTAATVHQLQVGNIDLVALARTLATDVSGRHLQLWDENPQYERTLREVGASGDVDTDNPSRTFHVAVENATATKLDYYVTVAISDTVYVLKDGSAVVDTTVTLTNHTPLGEPPSYQFGPDGQYSTSPGMYVGRVFLWGPRGSSQAASTLESGLELTEVDLPLPPQESATAHFETTIVHAVQNRKLQLVFVPQPRLTPESLRVHLIATHLTGGSGESVDAALSNTTTLNWEFAGLPN